MDAFSANWLALREPADHAARAERVTASAAGRLRHKPGLRAVDLAAGTGSNVRYLLPRLPSVTHWTLVDHDAALLAVARTSLEPLAHATGVTIQTVVADLNDVETLPLDGRGLVTASALLDLVSAEWLQALATRCATLDTDVLFALTYDGRIDCEPGDVWDEPVRDLVNRHQRTDKGLGAALGPDAPRVALDAFGAAEIVVAASDWLLDARHAELQRQLLGGWAGAAQALSSGDSVAIDAWLQRRLTWVDAGRSRIRVGHQDVSAST